MPTTTPHAAIGISTTNTLPLLASCPLLLLSDSGITGALLGAMTLLALAAGAVWTVSIGRRDDAGIHCAGHAIVAAAAVGGGVLFAHAWLPGLAATSTALAPVVVGVVVLLQIDATAATARPRLASGVAALALCALLPAVGALREVLSVGSVFVGAGLLPFDAFAAAADGFRGLRLAALAPGALVLLALLIAAGNRWRGGRRR